MKSTGAKAPKNRTPINLEVGNSPSYKERGAKAPHLRSRINVEQGRSNKSSSSRKSNTYKSKGKTLKQRTPNAVVIDVKPASQKKKTNWFEWV